MSIETYEKFCGRYELYHLLDEALEAESAGDHMDYRDFMAEFRSTCFGHACAVLSQGLGADIKA